MMGYLHHPKKKKTVNGNTLLRVPKMGAINDKKAQAVLTEKAKGRLALFDNYDNYINVIKNFLVKVGEGRV